MDQPGKINFKVDEHYENEKGVFRVISIHRDKMVIRWEDGEEIRTDIDLQRRIAERRYWRIHNLKAETGTPGKKTTKAESAGKTSVFSGFLPTDFKKTATGSKWRSRSQLGGEVTNHIDSTRFTFKSWAFGRKSEMHVQDIKHHDQLAPDCQAKFFVRLDQQALYYGFKAARPDNKDGGSADWEAFNQWLTRKENEEMVREIAVINNLTVSNRKKPSSGNLLPTNDGWQTDEEGQHPDNKPLAMHINDTPEQDPFELELFASIAKGDAVELGRDIAANIAQLFTQLIPLYRATVTY